MHLLARGGMADPDDLPGFVIRNGTGRWVTACLMVGGMPRRVQATTRLADVTCANCLGHLGDVSSAS